MYLNLNSVPFFPIKERDFVVDIFDDVPKDIVMKSGIFFNLLILDMYVNIVKYLISDSNNDIYDLDLEDSKNWEILRKNKSLVSKIIPKYTPTEDELTPKETDTMEDRIERIYKFGEFSQFNLEDINITLMDFLREHLLDQKAIFEYLNKTQRLIGYLSDRFDIFISNLNQDKLIIPPVPLISAGIQMNFDMEERICYLLFLASIMHKTPHCQNSYSDISIIIIYLLGRAQDYDDPTFYHIFSLLYYTILSCRHNNLYYIGEKVLKFDFLIDPYKIRLIINYVIDLIKPGQSKETSMNLFLQFRFFDLYSHKGLFESSDKSSLKSMLMLFYLSPYEMPEFSLEYRYRPITSQYYLRANVYHASQWLVKNFVKPKENPQ